MDDNVLSGKKLEAYVILKILKYCTDSSARSYQCKFAVQQVFLNKKIESMEELGAAIKEIIQYRTIRGKFSSVHPDLVAEGIARVEVGEEGLHFIREREPGELFSPVQRHSHLNFQMPETMGNTTMLHHVASSKKRTECGDAGKGLASVHGGKVNLRLK